MTQKTFRITRILLMVLSVSLSLLLVYYLQAQLLQEGIRTGQG